MSTIKQKVKFMEWLCDVEIEHYHDGRKAISLTHPLDGPVATATVNLPGADIPSDPNFTLIKTWSENKGILEALLEAGIVEDTGLSISVNPFGSVARLVKVIV